jgi:hypothetical protein
MTIALLDKPTYPFSIIMSMLRGALIKAPITDVGEWQARPGGPQARTAEVEDASFAMALPFQLEAWAEITKPNLPWADEHFAERVGGVPLNPPPSHIHWPFATAGNTAHQSDEKFSHTYPERLWPRFTEHGIAPERRGIRFQYGDLRDALQVLRARRQTRQVFIPIWFPEDLAAAREGQRVPCTLGYHVMVRKDRMKIVYYMRSCDFIRHFNDDVYMAGRLAHWLCEQTSPELRTSRLVMHISSLHVFEADLPRLRRDAERT